MYRRSWIVKPVINGFQFQLLVWGTEEEMRSYMEHEFKECPAYRGATEEEVDQMSKMGAKVYLAPPLTRRYNNEA